MPNKPDASNPTWRRGWQSTRPLRRVAELWSLGNTPFERMRTRPRRMSVTLGFCLLALPIFADFYPQVTLDPTVSKFLGEGLEFSASVERMVVLDSAGRTNATFIFKSVKLKKPANG